MTEQRPFVQTEVELSPVEHVIYLRRYAIYRDGKHFCDVTDMRPIMDLSRAELARASADWPKVPPCPKSLDRLSIPPITDAGCAPWWKRWFYSVANLLKGRK